VTEKKDERDVIFVGPENGRGGNVALRCRGGMVTDAGSIHPLENGKPIMGEAVRLHPRDEGGGYYMEYLVEPAEPGKSKGPTKVNSRAYRDNWDEIFGKRGLFGTKVRPGDA
jgi:hypothetical protein